MAQAQRGRHRTFRIAVEVPRLLAGERRVGRMQSVDRAERAELVPAGLQLFVAVAEHVAADVVAPPAYPMLEAVAVNCGWKASDSQVTIVSPEKPTG